MYGYLLRYAQSEKRLKVSLHQLVTWDKEEYEFCRYLGYVLGLGRSHTTELETR
jgi:hypothetical protein